MGGARDMTVRVGAVVLGCVMVAGCTGSTDEGTAGSSAPSPPSAPSAAPDPPATTTAAPVPSKSVSPTRERERFDDWVVGASPLPLRPDGTARSARPRASCGPAGCGPPTSFRRRSMDGSTPPSAR